MCKLPPQVGFFGEFRIGTIACLSKEGEMWDPFIIVGSSETHFHFITPQLEYNEEGTLLFGKDMVIDKTPEFEEKSDEEYTAMEIPVEIDESGQFYVHGTDIKIIFPDDIDEIYQGRQGR